MLLALLGGAMPGFCTGSALADTPATATPSSAQIRAPASPALTTARPSAVQATLPSAAMPPASASLAPKVLQPATDIQPAKLPVRPVTSTTPNLNTTVTTPGLTTAVSVTSGTAAASTSITIPAPPGAGTLAEPITPPAATSGSAPLFSAPAFSPPPAEKIAEEPAFESGQVLVLWATDESAASGIAILQQRYQLRPRQRYKLASLGFTLVMYALPSEREALLLRVQLRAEHPDWIVDLNARSVLLQATKNPTQETPVVPRLYAQKMLSGVAGPVPTKLEPPSLRLGVVDTGVDSALAQAATLNGSVINMRSVLGPADKAADTAHGSAILQLMVGAEQRNGFAGSAPPVRVSWASAMRELNGKASTNSLLLALALDWLMEQEVSMINMSLGGQGDAVLKTVIARIVAKNVLILAAVGNNPDRNTTPIYPAAYAGVWAITAVDAAGKLYSQASPATHITLAAPGAELWVPTNGGMYVSGTSYATALASATLAWQPPRFWTLPSIQRRSQVCAQARKLQDDIVTGCGVVQKNINLPVQ